MASGNGDDSASRLAHIERGLAQLIDAHLDFEVEHKQLLTAQVLLTDRMDQLTVKMAQLVDAQRHTDDRLSALIGVVDGFIRAKGGQQQT